MDIQEAFDLIEQMSKNKGDEYKFSSKRDIGDDAAEYHYKIRTSRDEISQCTKSMNKIKNPQSKI